MNFYKQLGKNIKVRRKEVGLTQQQLADKMGIGLNFMGKIEVAFSKPSRGKFCRQTEIFLLA